MRPDFGVGIRRLVFSPMSYQHDLRGTVPHRTSALALGTEDRREGREGSPRSGSTRLALHRDPLSGPSLQFDRQLRLSVLSDGGSPIVIKFRDGNWKLVSTNPAGRLLDRLPAFVPDWSPADTGPGRALLEIAERFTAILAERLVKAPDKARLAIPRCPRGRADLSATRPGPGRVRADAGSRPCPCPGSHPASRSTAGWRRQPDLRDRIRDRPGRVSARRSEGKPARQSTTSTHSQDVTGEKPFVLFASPQSIPRKCTWRTTASSP